MKPSFRISQDSSNDSQAIKHEDLSIHDFTNRVTSLQPSVCSLLSEQRNKLGISLKKISEELRIAETYLKALEDANLKLLPERVYTLGFIRSYARYLNLDPIETINRFKTEVLGDAVNTNYTLPKPVQGDHLPNRWLIWLTSIVIIGGFILGWIYYTLDTPSSTKSHAIPTVIQDDIKDHINDISISQNIPVDSHQVPGTKSLTNLENTNDTQVYTSATPATISVHQVEPITNNVDSLTKNQQLNPLLPDKSIANNVGHDGNELKHVASPTSGYIQLKFTALSWVEIRDEYGTTIVNRNFKAGESYNIELKPGLLLSTGNAGGINVVLPSNQVFCMGKPGEVLHGVSLNFNRS